MGILNSDWNSSSTASEACCWKVLSKVVLRGILLRVLLFIFLVALDDGRWYVMGVELYLGWNRLIFTFSSSALPVVWDSFVAICISLFVPFFFFIGRSSFSFSSFSSFFIFLCSRHISNRNRLITIPKYIIIECDSLDGENKIHYVIDRRTECTYQLRPRDS